MKYRKKPVLIDAFVWTGDTEQNQFPFPEWAFEKIKRKEIEIYENALFTHGGRGSDIAKIGYYIILDQNGDVSSRSPNIFEEEYEKVEEQCAD